MEKVIDLAKQVLDIENQVLTVNFTQNISGPLTVGKALHLMLDASADTKLSKMRKWELQQMFYTRKSVNLNMSEIEILKELVEKDQVFRASVGAQVLVALISAKDNENKGG